MVGNPKTIADDAPAEGKVLIRATLGQSWAIRLHQPPCCVPKAVRTLTRSARARITVRWSCACTLRCRTGPNNSGSTPANRARVCASCRSSFRLLLVIHCTFCACATITSCPNSVSCRLTQGECVPLSSATRLRGIFPKVCLIASGVVGSFCSKTTWPASSLTQ